MSSDKSITKQTYRKVYILADPGLIYPFIPGTIISYFVKKGDSIKKGDKLFILEAMKMNNEVMSPIDGVVKKINFQPGHRVSKNDAIIEIE